MRAIRSQRVGDPQGDPLPSAPIEHLRARAKLLARVRGFFDERGVLEVETPILCRAGAVDVHLDPFPVRIGPEDGAGDGEEESTRYLMTSPELCMKRLLAAGSGPIYQLTRAFRRGERGRLHNPEFTLLEWYRPGYDLDALMDEVEGLVREAFKATAGDIAGSRADRAPGWRQPFERITYQSAFVRALGIDPLTATVDELRRAAGDHGADVPPAMREGPVDAAAKDDWLHLLMSTCIDDSLGASRPTFLYGYPASQAALARISADDPRVAERFELYIAGIELANGYHELTDAREQRRRFEAANEERAARGKAPLPVDGAFLRALENGLPDCSGVALGLDRLVLLALGASRLDEVMAFPASRS